MNDPTPTTPPDPPPESTRSRSHAEGNAVTLPEAAAGGGPARAVAGYQLGPELGRGGMGVVYKARQLSLNRDVALKLVLHADHAGEDRRRRFVREAEALGRLRHPNIVQVFEAGLHEGMPFFSMEYVAGGNLAEYLRGTPLPPADAAGLVETLARAVEHAHGHGLLHRDLKPANILMGNSGSREFGNSGKSNSRTASGVNAPGPTPTSPEVPTSRGPDNPKITDFGLAKDLGDDGGKTESGALLGTPSYMAPEQAGGHNRALDARTDVYALGAILYECLTGRPPFKAATPAETLMLVVGKDPVAPRALQPGVPRDLETVCLKCLEKDPRRRYPTAEALADDLGRFLSGEPTAARPVGAVERAVKWVRRRPATAALVGAVVGVFLAGAGSFAWAYSEALRERVRADDEAGESRRNEAIAREEGEKARREEESAKRQAEALRRVNAGGRVALADAMRGQRTFAGRFLTAEQRGRESNAALGQQAILLAAHEQLDGVPRDLRFWDWQFAKRAVTGGRFAIPLNGVLYNQLAFAPDGEFLAGGGGHGVQLWDAATGRQGPHLGGYAVAVGVGRRLAVSGDDVRVWVPDRWQAMAHKGGALSLAFAPDGKHLAGHCRDNTVRVWETGGGREVARWSLADVPVPGAEFSGIAFSPDGRVLTGGYEKDHTLKVFDSKSGKLALLVRGHAGPVHGVACSPDGRYFATAGGDAAVKLWDARTGAAVRTFPGHMLSAAGVAFSPDGGRLVSGGSDGLVKVWDVATGEELASLGGHLHQMILAVAFSHDGQRVASVAFDFTIKVWDVREPLPAAVMACPAERSVAIAPDGKTVAAVGGDGRVRLAGVGDGRAAVELPGHDGKARDAAWDYRGGQLATCGDDGAVVLWDAETRKEVRRIVTGAACNRLAFAGVGLVAAGAADGVIRLWDAGTGRERGTMRGHTAAVTGLACDPGRGLLASVAADGTARIWDVAGRKELRVLRGHSGEVLSVAVLPGGPVATGGKDRLVKVWDADTGRELLSLGGHGAAVRAVAFSPGGERLVSAGEDTTAVVWDSQTGVQVLTLRGHRDYVSAAAFCPHGHRLATAGRDNSIRMWDGRPGVELATLRGHAGEIYAISFSADGRQALTGSDDGTARLWDLAGGRELLRLDVGGKVFATGFSADGRRLQTRRFAGPQLEVWDRATGRKLDAPAEPIPPLPGMASGDGRMIGLVNDNVVRVVPFLPSEEEQQSRRAWTARDDGWHAEEAARCERLGRWFAALFHLDQLLPTRPKDAELLARKARALSNLGRKEEALRAATRAILLDPMVDLKLQVPTAPAMPPSDD